MILRELGIGDEGWICSADIFYLISSESYYLKSTARLSREEGGLFDTYIRRIDHDFYEIDLQTKVEPSKQLPETVGAYLEVHVCDCISPCEHEWERGIRRLDTQIVQVVTESPPSRRDNEDWRVDNSLWDLPAITDED